MPGPIRFDPYAYEFHEDPYPVYRRLRDEAPVHRNDELGFFTLSRHADVLAAFKDVDTFSSRNGVSLDADAFHPNADVTMSFLAMDPPRHTRMRSLVSRGFTPRRVMDLEPRIRALAVRYLDECEGRERCDFIAEFAGRLPMDVVSLLLGVPDPDRDTLRAWADTVVHREEGVRGVPPAAGAAALRLLQYFQAHVADRRANPRDDLTGALLSAEIDGDRLTEREVLGFLFLMIVAGNETTTKLLANALYWLWRNPAERDRVRADPALVPDWIEETLRYDNTSQALARVVARDVEIHGTKLREGEKLVLLIGSANRDERAFEDPDRYDVRRSQRTSLSFGHGTHYCLGAALARLEARIALEEFWRRFPDYEVEAAGVARIHSVNVRGFRTLPIRLRP